MMAEFLQWQPSIVNSLVSCYYWLKNLFENKLKGSVNPLLVLAHENMRLSMNSSIFVILIFQIIMSLISFYFFFFFFFLPFSGRIYRCLFTGSVSSLLTLPLDMLSTYVILFFSWNFILFTPFAVESGYINSKFDCC